MERPRSGWPVLVAFLALVGCKGKASSSSGGDDAGATAPSAASSTPPAPSSPPPTPSTLSSLVGFEGEIDVTAKGADPDKPAQPMIMLVKGDKVQLDGMPGADLGGALGKAWVLVRAAEKKIDVVVETKKQVLELDLNNRDVMKGLQKVGSGPQARGAKADPPLKFTKTGTKETIAGYSCEDWEVTSAKENEKKASLCVANLASTFFHIPLTGVPGEYAFATELMDGKHFPLRIISYEEHSDVESGRLEVTKLDSHPVEASKVEIPAGYQTVDMMQMIQALMGGGHIPGVPSNLPAMPNAPGGPADDHHPHR